MLKNINQSMVNRSIIGGGGNCKCINGNGVNGSDVSGGSSSNGIGKVILDYSMYKETEGGNTNYYITEEDALKIYTQLYNVYPTKYTIFKATILLQTEPGKSNNMGNIVTDDVYEDDSASVFRTIFIYMNGDDQMSLLCRFDDKYTDGHMKSNISDGLSIDMLDDRINISPDAASKTPDGKTVLTLYYMER